MELKIFTNQQEWIDAVLQEINAMPANSVVALAGGSTPLPIYSQITNFEPTYILTDERENRSNFGAITKVMPRAKIIHPTIHTKLSSLDLLILGMGEDGHYASHFTDTRLIKAGEFYDEVEVPSNEFTQRITLNQKTLSDFKKKILVITGKDKLIKLQNLPPTHFIASNQILVYALTNL